MDFIPTQKLEERARSTLFEADVFRLPVPLELLAHRLGILIQKVLLGDDVSGVLVVSGDHGVIGVNQNQSTVRQRFTVAHEIGHFVLHRDQAELFIDKTYVAFRSSETGFSQDRSEIQANQFAAALLMPEELVQEKLGNKVLDMADAEIIEDLAGEFGVSSQAMTFRLENLGMLQNGFQEDTTT